jgi:hypothetical protein
MAAQAAAVVMPVVLRLVERSATSCSPTSLDRSSAVRASSMPAPMSLTVAADHRASQPTSPHTRTPWRAALQDRDWDDAAAAVFINAMVVKIRDGQVRNRPAYAAIGSRPGRPQGTSWAFGPGDGDGESMEIWLAVLTE